MLLTYKLVNHMTAYVHKCADVMINMNATVIE